MQSKMFTLAGAAALALGACTVQEDKDKAAGQRSPKAAASRAKR